MNSQQLPDRLFPGATSDTNTDFVIAETDQALAAIVKTKVLGAAASQIAVSFDPPSRPWIQALKAPTINFFLFDLRENSARRESQYVDIRNEEGKVVGRKPPMQRWDLHYTVSVFAPQVMVEHRILGAVLRYFSQMDVIEPNMLPPELGKHGYPVLVTTGSGSKRGMFLNYAGDIKASFEMAITVPVPPLPPPPPAPPVQAPPQIQVNPAPVPGADQARTASPPETVQARPAQPPAPPAPTTAPEQPAKPADVSSDASKDSSTDSPKVAPKKAKAAPPKTAEEGAPAGNKAQSAAADTAPAAPKGAETP